MTPKGPPISSPDAKGFARPVLITLPTRFDNAITTFPQMKEVKIGRQLTALVQATGTPPTNCVQGRSDTTVTDAGPNSSVIAPPVRWAVTGFGTTVFGASNVLTLSIFGAANVSPRSVAFF